MTAEVLIMNQQALVLAADSATTVTMSVDGGKREDRYFKGTNKLFQLSSVHPVGLMIYGSASLHEVPWELLIKDFRQSLQSESHDELSGYSKRFFDFVKGHSLFPAELRRRFFLDEALRTARPNFQAASEEKAVADAGDEQKPAALRSALERIRDKLKKKTPAVPVTSAEVDAAIATHAESVAGRIRAATEILPPPEDADVPLLAEVAICDLMVNYADHLSETGVVVGGYGEKDYFPGSESYRCYGFLDQAFVCNPDGNPTKVADLPASIQAFGTTSMIDTFRLGISTDLYTWVQHATRKELGAFARKLLAELAPDKALPGNLEDLIDEALRNHKREWSQEYSIREHYGPLARVISALPISDMAALAKSLIELQSLKERVTKPTETVSGPIDVAVITKHDGFVWIERKHYFKPELNPRFFVRQKLGSSP